MNRSALIFTIITVITIICWISFSVVRALTTPQIPSDVQDNVKSITSTFDKVQLEKIYKERNTQ